MRMRSHQRGLRGGAEETVVCSGAAVAPGGVLDEGGTGDEGGTVDEGGAVVVPAAACVEASSVGVLPGGVGESVIGATACCQEARETIQE